MIPRELWKVPDAPPAGSVASSTAIRAPSAAFWNPWPPFRSVAQYPGSAALTRIAVSRSSLAYCTVTALSAVFDDIYARWIRSRPHGGAGWLGGGGGPSPPGRVAIPPPAARRGGGGAASGTAPPPQTLVP